MIIINPGSGPVSGATEENAKTNLETLALDLIERGRPCQVVDGPLEDQGDGRWEGKLRVDGRVHEVEMPGLPVEQVRYLGAEDQDIWDFPRLYVNGSSWVWMFALDVLADSDEDE